MWQPDRVQTAESRLRELVNHPRRQDRLLRNRPRWLQLCAAMDAIGDTQLAIRSFLEGAVHTTGDGGSYIVAYGVLQTLYVQQDAAKKIAEVLSIPFAPPEEIRAIRDTRNAAIGHPADYKRNRSAAIVRVSLSPTGFDLLVYGPEGFDESRTVNLPSLCREQTDVIGALLEAANAHLIEEELVHRRKYRGQTLAAAFTETLGYALEKVGEGLGNSVRHPLGEWGLSTVEDVITQFRSTLAERGLEGVYAMSAEPLMQDISFSVQRLRALLRGEMPQFDERDGRAYLSYLRTQLAQLQEVAIEIDNEYASDDI